MTDYPTKKAYNAALESAGAAFEWYRKMAGSGADLSRLEGTGAGGKIIVSDVVEAAERGL